MRNHGLQVAIIGIAASACMLGVALYQNMQEQHKAASKCWFKADRQLPAPPVMRVSMKRGESMEFALGGSKILVLAEDDGAGVWVHWKTEAEIAEQKAEDDKWIAKQVREHPGDTVIPPAISPWNIVYSSNTTVYTGCPQGLFFGNTFRKDKSL